jgi:hypothetical protein
VAAYYVPAAAEVPNLSCAQKPRPVDPVRNDEEIATPVIRFEFLGDDRVCAPGPVVKGQKYGPFMAPICDPIEGLDVNADPPILKTLEVTSEIAINKSVTCRYAYRAVVPDIVIADGYCFHSRLLPKSL